MKRSLEPVALLIKKAQHRQNRMMEASLASLGVSLVQWNAMREIHRNPGHAMHQLAELTFNSDQAFGTLTSRLLRLGFITRMPGAGRAVMLELTSEGETVLHAGYPLILRVCTRSFAALSEAECGVLATLLTKMLDASGRDARVADMPPPSVRRRKRKDDHVRT